MMLSTRIATWVRIFPNWLLRCNNIKYQKYSWYERTSFFGGWSTLFRESYCSLSKLACKRVFLENEGWLTLADNRGISADNKPLLLLLNSSSFDLKSVHQQMKRLFRWALCYFTMYPAISLHWIYCGHTVRARREARTFRNEWYYWCTDVIVMSKWLCYVLRINKMQIRGLLYTYMAESQSKHSFFSSSDLCVHGITPLTRRDMGEFMHMTSNIYDKHFYNFSYFLSNIFSVYTNSHCEDLLHTAPLMHYIILLHMYTTFKVLC